MQGAPAILHQHHRKAKPCHILTFFGAKKEAKKHPPSPRPLPIWRGCNRSSCRSYINVSSTHQRVGMLFYNKDHPLGSAAYMSEASL